MRSLALLLILALVGGLIGWSLHERPADEGGLLPAAVGPEADERAPTLHAGGAPRPARGEPGLDDPATTDGEGPTPHRVTGRIAGLDAAELLDARVRVQVLRQYDWADPGVKPVVGTPARDGTFAVDLGGLRHAHPKASRIRVSVDHPRHLVQRVKLDLAPLSAGQTTIADPITLTAALLVPVQVLDTEGSPRAGAKVALYAMFEGEVAVSDQFEAEELDRGTTDANGRCNLRTLHPGRALLAAASTDLLPVSKPVTLRDGTPTEHHTLRLAAGHAIRGHVHLNGEVLVGATVRATPVRPGSETPMTWIDAIWSDGRIHPGQAEAMTDATGGFALTARDRTPHGLRVVRIAGVFLGTRTVGWSEREVTPPALDVDIALEAVHLELDIVSGTRPVKGASLAITKPTATRRRLWSSPEGTFKTLLPADTVLTVMVEHELHESAKKRLEAMPAGSRIREVIDLGPAKASARLRVTLKTPAGEPVTSAGFLLTKNLGEHGAMLGFESGLGLKHSPTGEFLLAGLEPGTFRCAVFPERAPDAHRGTWLVHQETLTLIEGREHALAVTALRGATVRVTVRSEDGALLDAYATLRDDRGEEVRVSWFWSNDTSAHMSTSGPGPAINTMTPPLPPGEYELEMSAEEHASRKTRFSVTTGETKSLEITLRKE